VGGKVGGAIPLSHPNSRQEGELFIMEREIRIDQQIINKYKPDGFALQQVLRGTGASREYEMDGQWTDDKPTQKPERTRIVFDSREQFRIARDVYFIWQDLILQKEDNPVKPEAILERLLQSRKTGKPVMLFVPWGVRPQGRLGRSEIKALNQVQNMQQVLQRRNISAQVLIMPADLYATEVNQQVDVTQTTEYFEQVTSFVLSKGFLVKPWSEIRGENIYTYRQRASELTPQELESMFKAAKIEEAIAAAARRSGYQNKHEIQQAAFAYLRERVCEAEIIESIYKPIKLSAVSKNKDNDVDRDLPRLYVIPKEFQFPWLK